MKKYFSLLLILLVLFLIGCNVKEDKGLSNEEDGKIYDVDPSEYSPKTGRDEELAPSGDAPSGDTDYKSDGYYGEAFDISGDYDIYTFESERSINISSHQLTASVNWDNEKFDYWKELISTNQKGDGEFKKFYENYAFNTYYRIKISVPKGIYATVKLLNDNNDVVYQSVTDVNGVAYLFSAEQKENYKVKIEYLDNEEVKTIDDVVTGDKEYDFEALSNKKEQIELMFVIDATGSMGDEMNYLLAEIKDVITQVKKDNENVEILLAIMVYRDTTDEYVTRYSDFTQDIDSQIDFLSEQSANGGGDFEEAVHTALIEASNKQWTETASTKILVHVADAPSHDKDVIEWNAAVKSLASKGVRIITVSSSGINKKTEYFFRSQSIMTNGAYVYLTNDSGIGGGHIDASTEEKNTVEFLNSLLIRLINGYYTGDFGVAVDWRQEAQGE